MVLKHCAIFAMTLLISACSQVQVKEHPVPPPAMDPDCLTSLLASGNNQDLEMSFELTSEMLLRVVGQGEGASFSLTPGLVESFHNDCVEFFIDQGDFNRQYRFVWGDPKVEGKYADMNGVVFAQADPSETSYLFEIAFPWRTLGLSPASGALRMDVSISDNDDQSRKTQMAWSGVDGNLWKDPSQYGEIILNARCSHPPVIDGLIDSVWDSCEIYEVTHLLFGSKTGPEDLAAWFRILFDDTYLYLLVEVQDNVKRQAAFLFDNGSITDEYGNELWRMSIDCTSHAGGALKNRRQEDTLRLPAGRYRILYSTDESHSAGHWDDTPPDDAFSGIKIYSIGL